MKRYAIRNGDYKNFYLVKVVASRAGDDFVYREGFEEAVTYKHMVAKEMARKCHGVAVPVKVKNGKIVEVVEE